jgi:hypothetical protein
MDDFFADEGPGGRGGPQPRPNGHPPAATLYPVYNAGEALLDPIPPRGWLLSGTFCRGFISMLAASGGTGKTALRIAQLMACATGLELTGEHVFQQCRVLLVSQEDGELELRRRLEAARRHFGISHEQLLDAFYFWCPLGLRLSQTSSLTNRVVPDQLETELRAVIIKYRIDIVALDPLIKASGVPENDNTGCDFVMVQLAKIATDLDCAVDLLHHISKGGILQPGDSDRARGASALRDAARLLATMTPMLPGDAEHYGISESERRSYVRVDHGKVNIVAPRDHALWFRLRPVPLNNGTPQYPAGDEVHVAERWKPPDAWDLVGSAQQRILKQIDEGPAKGRRYSGHPRAGADRAGWRVVRDILSNKVSRSQAQEIIEGWLQSGILRTAPYRDPEQRRFIQGLYVRNGNIRPDH